MLIKMKKTTPVSTTGLNSMVWEKGEVHEAPADLIKALVDAGLAVTRKGEVIPEKEPSPEPSLESDIDPDPPKDNLGESDINPAKDLVEELDLDQDKDGIIEIDE